MQIQKANMDKEHDLFSEIVKNKLANYTLPVDDDSWDKVAKRLNPPLRKKTRRPWIAAIAVAASIALLFLIFPINKKTHHYETANQVSDYEETIIQDVSEKEIVRPILSQDVESSPSFRKSRLRERLPENSLTTEVILKEEIAEENPVVSPKEEPSAPENHPISVDSYYDLGKKMQMPSIKQKKRQSLRFSFGSGGSLLAENNTNLNSFQESPKSSDSPYFRAATQTENKSRTEEILSYENYPDVTRHLPLSFGVTAKRELNRTFAIESGIVYSYITTSFGREFYPKSKADLQLHYIGVPLNLHTRIYGDRFSRWEVYLSTGGAVEKGVLSHFVQKTYYDNMDNYMKRVVSDEKIKGLQWSIGISPGVDYQIHKNYSIYFEPRLSYYFDSDQPVSARTAHPVVVGINAGVRYTW